MKRNRALLAIAMIGVLTATQCTVFAISSEVLEEYEKIVNSQGQTGVLDTDAVGQIFLVEGTDDPTWDATTDTTTDTTTDATTDTTTPEVTTPEVTTPEVTTPEVTTPEVTTPTYTTMMVTLTQSYNSEFNVYEFSASNRYFIYSNVANGGIVAGEFYVDIPYNVTYTMEKDGMCQRYTRKNTISELGSYLFTFTYVDEENLVKYVSTLRFRIEAPVVTEETILSDSDLAALGDDFVFDPETGTVTAPEVDGDTALEDVGNVFIYDPTTGEIIAVDGEDPLTTTDQLPETDAPEDTALSTAQGLICTYDEDADYYKNTLSTGGYFWSNVPNGMTTSGSVVIKSGEGTINYQAYCDGEPVDFTTGQTIKDAGTYTIFPVEETSFLITATDSPCFSFTILPVDARVNVTVMALPETHNLELSAVSLDETPIEFTAKSGNLLLLEDGLYTLTLTGAAGEFTVTFTRDTVAPTVAIDTSKNNQATISCSDEDVYTYMLYQDDTLVTQLAVLTMVSEPGDYVLLVYDMAGNITQQAFTITYGLNTGAIVGVILVIALILGIAIAVKRMRSKVSVR